jgi:hypothetical protein
MKDSLIYKQAGNTLPGLGVTEVIAAAGPIMAPGYGKDCRKAQYFTQLSGE